MASNRRARRLALLNLTLLVASALSIGANTRDSSLASLNELDKSPNDRDQQQQNGIDSEDVWIDAFDLNVCGQAKLRPWQEQQRAFGCAGRSHEYLNDGMFGTVNGAAGNDVSPRIFGGEMAAEGEFPSYVHINKTGKFACGATLIDENLVVTAAHCLKYKGERSLIFGSNWYNGTGGEVRKIGKFCYPKSFVFGYDVENDIAIIRLDEPIQYVREKIWPACLNLDARHMDGAVCAFAGLGRNDNHHFLAPGTDPDHLKTLAVKRSCASTSAGNSCYLANQDNRHKTQPGDSGSPLYCYDRCHGSGDSVQAYVVGALSGLFNDIGTTHTRVADFNLLRSAFFDLLKTIQLKGIQSSNDTNCSDTFI